jgi:hypothetical protein
MPAAIDAQAELAGSFAADGFAIARGLIPRAEVDGLNAAFLEQAARGPVPGMFDGDPRADASDPLARLPRMMHPHRQAELPVGPLAMRYMLDPRVGAILAALLGDEPIATQSMYYFKPPGARGQALHQDNFYLVVRPGTCIAAWLALDDADEENGGMVMVPGSHRHGIYCPEQADMARSFSTHFVRPPEGLSEAPVRLRAGDVLFFNGSLIHGSYENRSPDRFRRAFICHYMPAGSTTVSRWYSPLFGFDGREVQRELLDAGAICGEAVAGPH